MLDNISVELIIFVLFAIIVIYKVFIKDYRQFDSVEGFVDPYSLCLHSRALDKQYWWNLTHRRKQFEMRPYTLQIYKE